MTDIVSFGVARDYIRSRVTQEFLNYDCRVERVGDGSYDEDNLIYTSGSRVVVYEGRCRVWAITGSNTVVLESTELQIEQTQISFPWDINPLPLRFDEVLITSAPPQDLQMVNKRFEIQDYATAGELRPTRRYTVIAKQGRG